MCNSQLWLEHLADRDTATAIVVSLHVSPILPRVTEHQYVVLKYKFYANHSAMISIERITIATTTTCHVASSVICQALGSFCLFKLAVAVSATA